MSRDVPFLGVIQVVIAMTLILVTLGWSMPSAYRRVGATFREADRTTRWLAGAAMGFAVITRWGISPLRISTIWGAYRNTQWALDVLPVPHYGSGVFAWFRLLLFFGPHDHHALMMANAVLGVLTIPLIGTFAARFFGEVRIGALAAAIVAATPMFIRNDTSDAMQVPAMWWFWCGLVLMEDYLSNTSSTPMGLRALVPLTLTCVSRPELPVQVAASVALLIYAMRPPHEPWRDSTLRWGAMVAGALVIPHALHTLSQIGELKARSSLQLSWHLVSAIPRSLLKEDAVLRARLFPMGLLPFAIAGAWRQGRNPEHAARTRRARSAIACAMLAVVAVSIDAHWENMARVHVPAAMFVAIVAAVGMSYFWDRFGARATGAATTLIAATAIPSGLLLWHPTNEQAEEDFIRESLEAVPSQPNILIRVDHEDRNRLKDPGGFTHHHFPDYLFAPPKGHSTPMGLNGFADHPVWDRPVFAYLGMRCHALFREPGQPVPSGDTVLPACARITREFRLEPLLEREVKNEGDLWIRYYPDAPTLKLGLYRVRPKTGEQSPHAGP